MDITERHFEFVARIARTVGPDPITYNPCEEDRG